MKFSLALVASLASIVAAGNLRASSSSNDATVASVQGRVMLTGLEHLPTADELALVDHVVLQTYNDVYEQANMVMLTMSSSATLLRDDNDDVTMIVSEIVQQSGGGHCTACKLSHVGASFLFAVTPSSHS